MRVCLSYLVLAGFIAICGASCRAGEVDPDEAYRQHKQELDRQILAERDKKMKENEAAAAALKEAHAKAAQLLKDTITVDGETIEVKEPGTPEEALGFTGDRRVRDIYEVSPDDFDIVTRERWALNLSDFKIDLPHYITGQTQYGMDKTWFTFTFSITNSSTKPRRIAPVFTAVTDRGAFKVNSGGYLPERLLANAMYRPMAGGNSLMDRELLGQNILPLESALEIASGVEKSGDVLKPSLNFQPGQTRWGAAMWSDFDNQFTQLKIVVSGLTNSHKYDEKLRRVMVLSFERISDGFDVANSQLKYKGKRWEYIWMWDQDITVPIPADAKDPAIKAQKIKTPAGGEKYVVAFPFEVKNSTKNNQDLAIMKVSFALPVEVDVGGMKVPVEVRLNDDGTSNIYKAQVLKELGGEVTKDRFQNKALVDGALTMVQRHTVTLEAGKTADKQWAIFDEGDVDWHDAIEQIESALSRSVDRNTMAKKYWDDITKAEPKLASHNPGTLYDARRNLNDDEIKSVKEQIVKALPDAVEKMKQKKMIVAYFNCVSGMSSGEQRISRSYRQPGVVDESWLKAWEALDAPSTPAP
ncbi:MAG TPA: hypothetical protein VKX17_04805 [Planctomycetota bacterium]|nr:hypothetical protein [Planctomycetota bacterium]